MGGLRIENIEIFMGKSGKGGLSPANVINLLQPLSLKCDHQSSMSFSLTSISQTLNQRLKLKIMINSCLEMEILDSTKDVPYLFL